MKRLQQGRSKGHDTFKIHHGYLQRQGAMLLRISPRAKCIDQLLIFQHLVSLARIHCAVVNSFTIKQH